MRDILIYIAVVAICVLAAVAARAEPYGQTFGGTCFAPADSEDLTEAFGQFDVAIIAQPNDIGFSIIDIIGTKLHGVAAITPAGDICVLWTDEMTEGDPA